MSKRRGTPESRGANDGASITRTIDRPALTHRDCECGLDHAGNVALFLDQNHFAPDRWSLDIDVGSDLTFFRVIINGVEQAEYGLARRHVVVSWWLDGAASTADLPSHLQPVGRRRARIVFIERAIPSGRILTACGGLPDREHAWGGRTAMRTTGVRNRRKYGNAK